MIMAGNAQFVPLDDIENTRGIVARINHQSFVCLRIADNVAIALQHSHRQDFVNQFCGFGHGSQYSIGSSV